MGPFSSWGEDSWFLGSLVNLLGVLQVVNVTVKRSLHTGNMRNKQLENAFNHNYSTTAGSRHILGCQWEGLSLLLGMLVRRERVDAV